MPFVLLVQHFGSKEQLLIGLPLSVINVSVVLSKHVTIANMTPSITTLACQYKQSAQKHSQA